LVQPKGTVIVSFEGGIMSSYTSTNGGTSWAKTASIAAIQSHTDAGGIRSGPLPSAAVDGAGTVWVVWEDCRFRSGCSTNDLVYSTFPASASIRLRRAQAHTLPSTFTPMRRATAAPRPCQLFAGYISSPNGGSTWNAPVKLAGLMKLGWLPNSQNGLMVGDYIATAFSNGVPHGVFTVAGLKSGSTFNEAMYTAQGLTVRTEGAVLSSAGDKPLHKLSDKIEKEHPEKGVIPPGKRKLKRSQK